MSELLKHGWHECSNRQHNFRLYDFNVIKMIGHLIDCADMLKNQRGHMSLCATVPEYMLSDENTQSDTKEEDKDETNIDNN